MPHRLNRSEVATRLLIATLFDARPAMTRRELAAFFHVSFRTVIDAVHQPVARWVDRLAATPEPSNPGRSRCATSRRLVSTMAKRPGSRARAQLVEPELTIEYEERVDFDVPESEIGGRANDEAYAEADDQQDRVLRGVISQEERADGDDEENDDRNEDYAS